MVVLALGAAAFVATVVVAAVEFSRHHAALGAVGVTAALALLAAAALVAAGTRSRSSALSPERAASSLVPVDPRRLAGEIARAARSLGLDPTPVLVEVEAVASRLEQEHDDRRRADELDRALSELENRLTEREAAHRRVSRSIETETATIDAFEDAVRRAAASGGLDTSGTAADVCTRPRRPSTRRNGRSRPAGGFSPRSTRRTRTSPRPPGSARRPTCCARKLSSGDPVSWEAQGEAAKEQVTAAEREFQRARDAERDMAQQLEQLRSSHEIATLEMERLSLATQLEDALSEWTVLGLAEGLLEATFARYEREKQPAVIARAGELFTDVTAGRYVQLVADEDDRAARHGIDAISARDERVDSGSLSRGTAEQLYLCLRLGLAETHAERTVSLPFVLDDVLVNFDPGRAAAVTRAIVLLSRSHQVLAFTCHPHIVEVFRAADPACTVIELPLAEVGRTRTDP